MTAYPCLSLRFIMSATLGLLVALPCIVRATGEITIIPAVVDKSGSLPVMGLTHSHRSISQAAAVHGNDMYMLDKNKDLPTLDLNLSGNAASVLSSTEERNRAFCAAGLIYAPASLEVPITDMSNKAASSKNHVVSLSDSPSSGAGAGGTSSTSESTSSTNNPPTDSDSADRNPSGDEDEEEFSDSEDPDESDPSNMGSGATSSTAPRYSCSLKNKGGRHCEVYTCQRGGGSCRYSETSRKCVGRNLTGQNAPVACLACSCTRDRA